jgi:hypothetical protein
MAVIALVLVSWALLNVLLALILSFSRGRGRADVHRRPDTLAFSSGRGGGKGLAELSQRARRSGSLARAIEERRS